MADKFVLILLDGLGDRSYPELEHKTPLQAADTPFLDELAKNGCNGLFHASIQGQALPSENAHFAMFGYRPEDFPGRGALEALGAGINLNPDEVAVLANLVSVAEENRCLKLVKEKVRTDDSQFEQAFARVSEFTAQGISLKLIPYKGSFAIIVLDGSVSPYITDSHPIVEGRFLQKVKPWKEYDKHEPSIRTALVLNEYLSWVFRTLSNAEQGQSAVPVPYNLNGLITQRAGRLKQIVPFTEKFGLRGVSVSSGAVYFGLCRYLGLDHLPGEENCDPGKEISLRVRQAADILDEYDFVHIHSKAPDEAAHAKDPMLKMKNIEKLDKGLAASLTGIVKRKDVVLAVTSDHSTPSKGVMVHSGEPVPLIICGSRVRIDRVDKFNEVAAAAGGLGFVHGREFMYIVLNYLDRGKLAGLMDTPHDQPYWPGKSEPFELV